MAQKKGGVLNLYRGFNATLLRNIPGSVTYFTSYEVFCNILSPISFFTSPTNEKSKSMVITAGGFAGIVFWVTIFPFDVIKSHIQSFSPSSSSKPPTIREVATKLYTQRGIRGFFVGLSPALLRGFPTNGLSFLAFETCREWLE
uniref:Mitochondrial carrier protein n=2 Tax=Paramoeba aestuarina TaxID=180227 RepID=A0A7S4NQR2_9EUKA|mmetsp:Transcript_22840/g.35535  ORF Transcript_22840/g.35535 Transcript_22840/m.35535 type:complete len:144 (+) Transcript_22840:1379-1810(+)